MERLASTWRCRRPDPVGPDRHGMGSGKLKKLNSKAIVTAVVLFNVGFTVAVLYVFFAHR